MRSTVAVTLIVCLAFSSLGVSELRVSAAGPADWSKVQQLRPDSTIVITTDTAFLEDLRFIDADTDTIRVIHPREPSKPEEILRDSILEIAVERSAARWGALFGAGIVAALGIPHGLTLEGFLFYGGIHAGFWGLNARNFHTRRVVYRAASTARPEPISRLVRIGARSDS